MLVSVFSPKGGVGTTVTVALLGKAFAQYGPTMLIDACSGDIEAVMGADQTSQYCFADWLNSPEPTAQSLAHISIGSIENLDFVSGHAQKEESQLLEQLIHHEVNYEKRQIVIEALVTSEKHCVLDMGTELTKLNHEIALASDLVVMVLRECYLGLSRAIVHPLTRHVDACVVVQESGRSISAEHIASTLSLSTIIELDARRDYARCIDAGVLIYRTPSRLIAPISDYVSDVVNEAEILEDIASYDDEQLHDNQQFWAENTQQPSRLTLNSPYTQHVSSLIRGKK